MNRINAVRNVKGNVAKILDINARIFYYSLALRCAKFHKLQEIGYMNTITRWTPFHLSTLQDQVNRLFESTVQGRGDSAALTAWTPSVDIYETENELVIKADMPEINEKDLDIRVENNLTIRGERKFEQTVKEDNYLRIERNYGSFSRSFGLPNTVNTEAIKAEYKNGVLTVELPKSAESKPKQIEVNVANGKN
jgi:HSP20 family protein